MSKITVSSETLASCLWFEELGLHFGGERSFDNVQFIFVIKKKKRKHLHFFFFIGGGGGGHIIGLSFSRTGQTCPSGTFWRDLVISCSRTGSIGRKSPACFEVLSPKRCSRNCLSIPRILEVALQEKAAHGALCTGVQWSEPVTRTLCQLLKSPSEVFRAAFWEARPRAHCFKRWLFGWEDLNKHKTLHCFNVLRQCRSWRCQDSCNWLCMRTKYSREQNKICRPYPTTCYSDHKKKYIYWEPTRRHRHPSSTALKG